MGLWKTRHHSLEILSKDYKEQSAHMEEAFDVIDECIGLLQHEINEAAIQDNEQKHLFYFTCGIVLTKARNLALGTYGMMLDGLAQEAGALMRPFLEYHELLVYFRLDPERVKEAADDTLPPAGRRAQLIEGYFKPIREHLNDHASHSSFSEFSIMHLIDKEEFTLRKEQPLFPNALYKNIGDLYAHMTLLAMDAFQCLNPEGHKDLAKRIWVLHNEGYEVFSLAKKEESD